MLTKIPEQRVIVPDPVCSITVELVEEQSIADHFTHHLADHARVIALCRQANIGVRFIVPSG
jgi:hypothetical protein